MVRLAPNPSLRAASCWSVEVVNGGAGLRLTSFSRTSRTRYAASRRRSAWRAASASADRVMPFLSGEVASLPWGISIRRAENGASSPSGVRRTSTLQYSTGTKAAISRFRSTMSRRATDCTRPAERPGRTFFHRTGESRYPTSRSRIRRACWASTRRRSMARGLWKASRIASRVISVNVTRLAAAGSIFRTSAT